MLVAEIPDRMSFVSDSQIVDAITELFGIDEDYGSYFVDSIPSFEFGDYAMVSKDTVLESIVSYRFISLYGLEGIIPYNHKHAWRIDIDD